MEKFLTSQETANLLRINRYTLYTWRRKGTGPKCYKIGGAYVYEQKDLERFLNMNAVNSENKKEVL
jgi:predicted site-specific integrase-resolvase